MKGLLQDVLPRVYTHIIIVASKNMYFCHKLYTMDNHSKSLGQLSKFVDHYHLRDPYGNCQFNALVHIDLGGKVTMHQTIVRITMGGYEAGTVTLQDVDPNNYPAILKAFYQRITVDNELNLVIEDTHPRLGEYRITISNN